MNDSRPTDRPTKWSILQQRRDDLIQESLDLAKRLSEANSYLHGLNETKCGLTCGGCGEYLETEGDFARHFTVPDSRYLNLGDCPTGKRHNQPNVDDTITTELNRTPWAGNPDWSEG